MCVIVCVCVLSLSVYVCVCLCFSEQTSCSVLISSLNFCVTFIIDRYLLSYRCPFPLQIINLFGEGTAVIGPHSHPNSLIAIDSRLTMNLERLHNAYVLMYIFYRHLKRAEELVLSRLSVFQRPWGKPRAANFVNTQLPSH